MHERADPTPAKPNRRFRALPLGAYVCAVVLAATLLQQNRSFFHDDAFITLRYADNLLSGNGVVWNPGEYVQGYTNFLMLMLVAGLGALGLELTTAARVVGWASLIGVVVVVAIFGRLLSVAREARLWFLPVVLVMTSAPLLMWTLGGLEGPLLCLLATSGSLLLVYTAEAGARRSLFVLSGALFALGALTRPDGIVFIGVSLAWLLVTRVKRANVAAFVAPIAAILVPYVLWQWFYYGDVVPNTFHTKMGLPAQDRARFGLRYLTDYATRPPFLPVLTLLALAFAAAKRAWSSTLSYLTLAIVAYIGFIVVAGGDFMRAFRFFVPLIGLMCVTLGLALSAVQEKLRSRALPFVVVVVLGLAFLQLDDHQLNARGGHAAANIGVIVGLHIDQAWPEGSLVGINTAGSTPFFARKLRFIDMLGLNDAHIARRKIEAYELPWQHAAGHAKGDGAYVLDRKPDYIVIGPAQGSEITRPWFLSDLEMSRDPRFAEQYELVRVLVDNHGNAVDKNGALGFTYYRRKDEPTSEAAE